MSEENVKRKVLSVLSVEHQGILPRVTGLFSRRGFNIDSIIACKTSLTVPSPPAAIINPNSSILLRRMHAAISPIY